MKFTVLVALFTLASAGNTPRRSSKDGEDDLVIVEKTDALKTPPSEFVDVGEWSPSTASDDSGVHVSGPPKTLTFDEIEKKEAKSERRRRNRELREAGEEADKEELAKAKALAELKRTDYPAWKAFHDENQKRKAEKKAAKRAAAKAEKSGKY